MNKNSKIKGISLVELTVAMAILAMVFAGTVTLIITVVNLSFNTGLKTVAVALAQKGLTDKITEFRQTSNISPCTLMTTGLPTGITSLEKCVTANPTIPDAPNGLSGPDSFVFVTSKVTWYIRGDSNASTYQLVQIIRRNLL